MTNGMTPEEVRVRSAYLFLACSQAVDQLKDRLLTHLSDPPASLKHFAEKSLRRELGLLFRYWTTRQIWSRLDDRESDAKELNLALLRLFTDGFKLPKDGSGLRYAELSTAAEEVRELGHRVTNALGADYPELLVELQRSLPAWRDAVNRYTIDSLELPVDRLASSVGEWADRLPVAPDTIE